MSPLSNAYVKAEQLQNPETFYPLQAFVCTECWLVQLPEHETPTQIFAGDYAYFSSYSESWLAHGKAYTDMMLRRFGYGPHSEVMEIASNDGYLLQHFKAQNVPVLGIEPAENCAAAARLKGIESLVKFFGTVTARELAAQNRRADLLIGNNVLAHVPDINDFVAGMKIVLKVGGVVTMEFPHLLRLIDGCQFDTIYHEHYSYLSLQVVERLFARHGLAVFDVQELTTHGGSLRVFARHVEDSSKQIGSAVGNLRDAERAAGISHVFTYRAFAERVRQAKFQLLQFLIGCKRGGKRVWAYGAPAKGNTLLNYCGIRGDLLEATVDRSPHKQNRFLPGTHIPIFAPARITEIKPDYLLILPWNLSDEIMQQMAHIREWGGRFVIPIPELRVQD